LQFLQSNCQKVVKVLETAITNIRVKEELATLLVAILHKVDSVRDFLVDIIMDDVKGQGEGCYLAVWRSQR
jgi:hypothetical protein